MTSIASAHMETFITALRAAKIIAIVREKSADHAVAIGQRLLQAGIGILEVSLTTPGALEAITELRYAAKANSDALVGAGTVLDPESLERAAAAGAQFYVAPVFDRATLAEARELSMAAVPGCATPSEMWQAHRAGAAAIKVFPATGWTPAGLANVLRAMPFLSLVPTGGVRIADLRSWLGSGAIAVGIGSALNRDGDLREVLIAIRRERPSDGS